MKIIAASDLHIDLQNPVSRKDNYFDEILASFEYMLNYADSVDAEFLLVAGDFFDKPEQPGTVMRAVIELLRNFEHIRVITTVGQHDTNGHNAASYRLKSLGLLEAAGLLDVLISGESIERKDVIIRGFGFNEIETEEFLTGTDDFKMPEDKTVVAIVHASVGPDDCMGWAGISHQRIRSADVAVFGDIHCGFAPHTFQSGCVGLNAGSVGRRSISDKGRKQKFLELTLEDGNINIATVEIPSLPDESIFHDVEHTGVEEDIAAVFKEEWRKSFEMQDESPIDRVRRIGKAFEHPDNQIGLVLANLPQEVG